MKNQVECEKSDKVLLYSKVKELGHQNRTMKLAIKALNKQLEQANADIARLKAELEAANEQKPVPDSFLLTLQPQQPFTLGLNRRLSALLESLEGKPERNRQLLEYFAKVESAHTDQIMRIKLQNAKKVRSLQKLPNA